MFNRDPENGSGFWGEVIIGTQTPFIFGNLRAIFGGLLWFDCGLPEEAYGHSCTAPAFQLTGRGGPCTCPRLLWFECGLQEEAYGHSCTAPAFHLTGRGGPCTRPRLLWFQPMPMAWMRERYVCTRAHLVFPTWRGEHYGALTCCLLWI